MRGTGRERITRRSLQVTRSHNASGREQRSLQGFVGVRNCGPRAAGTLARLALPCPGLSEFALSGLGLGWWGVLRLGEVLVWIANPRAYGFGVEGRDGLKPVLCFCAGARLVGGDSSLRSE